MNRLIPCRGSWGNPNELYARLSHRTSPDDIVYLVQHVTEIILDSLPVIPDTGDSPDMYLDLFLAVVGYEGADFDRSLLDRARPAGDLIIMNSLRARGIVAGW